MTASPGLGCDAAWGEPAAGVPEGGAEDSGEPAATVPEGGAEGTGEPAAAVPEGVGSPGAA
jgi:hypothetical protein